MNKPRPYVRQLVLVLSMLVLAFSPASAQQSTAKRPLTHNDYDSWRSIQGPRISRDGKFLAYTLAPQDGDREVVVRNIGTGNEWKVITGYVPPVTSDATDEEPNGDATPQQTGPGLVFTSDSRSLVFQVLPTRADVEKARKEKKKPEDMPKNGLGIMSIATGEVTHVERVKNFRVPDDNAGFVVYQLEAKPGGPPAPKGTEYGTDLVIRTLTDQRERVFPDVLSYVVSRDGKSVVYAVASRTAESNGVYTVAPGSSSEPAALLSGKGKYTRLTWDEKQTELVFLSDRDDSSSKQPRFKLYGWDRQASAASEWVSTSTLNFKQGLVVSDKGNITFSLDGSRVFFGVAPPTDPAADTEEVPAEEKVVVDLWHYKDDYVQPMQRLRAAQDRNRTFRAVYDLTQKKYVQLADDSMDGVNPDSDGKWALGTDGRAYRAGGDFDARYNDVYLVNTSDGSRKALRQKQRGGLNWSPNGKYALYFDKKDWYAISIPDGKVTNLTKNINNVTFWQEEDDHPTEKPSYGSMGWTSDEKYVLLYDHYDVWQVAPDGSSAKNLTDGVGRKEKIVFRYVPLEEREPGDERGIDPTKPILLHATNESTRDDGFYRDRIDGGLPEKLIMGAKAYSNPIKAKDADVLVFTGSTFNEFPDLLVTNSQFQNVKKVSNANPQKANLIWGTSELVHYKNSDGVALTGILTKPENFDPTKKYPMMIYIYEKLSQNLHRFVNPSPGTSINVSYYASNGYLVLQPDIVYVEGYPGQSALKCVLPAIQAVVDKGFVNENAVGIQGHSWGGYQIAYMVTQTNRFKAAAPGAPVSDMISAYSGIRWGSGQPRQVQYERGQSRIGGSIWEYPMRYLENSPIFRVDRVQTPILMIHNDADTAVPWYQGIEYYLGLRRFGKEVYMFDYNGEPHGLRKRQNQKDYTMRLQQFFDNKLKGAPLPDWMEVGVPFLQREKAAAATKKKGQN